MTEAIDTLNAALGGRYRLGLNVAVGLLAVGMLIRFVPERDEGEDAEEADPGELGK